MFWIVVLIAFILKTVLTLLKSPSNNQNIIFFIIMLNVDIYCLNLTIRKKHRRYYEYSCKEDGETYENNGPTNFMTQSIATSQVSRGGSMSSAYRTKQQMKLAKLEHFSEKPTKPILLSCKKACLIFLSVLNLVASIIIFINEIYPLYKLFKTINHKEVLIVCVVLKGFCLVPFLTFEYYLLLFE